MRGLSLCLISGLLAAGLGGCAATTSPGALIPDAPASVDRGELLVPFERIVLDNGATLLLARKADVPLVSLSAILRGGAVTDSRDKFGLAALTGRLLEKGAGERDARTFSDTVANVGGQVSAAAGLESVQIAADFLAQDTELMIELVLDMIMSPHLPETEFEKLRTRSIESLKAARDGDPRGLVGRYGAAFLFGDHVYGNPVGGLEGTLAALTHDDVVEHHRRHYGADRLLLSVVGDIDVARVRERLETRLSGWSRATAALPQVEAQAPVAGSRVLLIDKPDATQSYFWMANVGVAKSYPDEAALDVANTILGGRFTSMLNTALRVESGLTYGAYSSVAQRTAPGSVSIASYTATATTIEAIDLARATLTKFLGSAPSEALLASARNYLRGQNPLGFETAAQMAGNLTSMAFYNQSRQDIDGYDAAVAGVDADALSRTTNEVFPTTDDLITVVIGRADDIRDALARYGTVEELSITQPTFSP